MKITEVECNMTEFALEQIKMMNEKGMPEFATLIKKVAIEKGYLVDFRK